MKGIVLSLLMSGFVALATVAVFHARPVTRRFRAMCLVFCFGLIGFIAIYQATPASPSESIVGLLNGLYFYVFLFFGVIAQAYALADRGFSLTMLTDFLPAEAMKRTREEIKQAYAGGKGMSYVKHKRMAQIAHGGLIKQGAGGYVSTPLGQFVGRVFLRLQDLYQFHENG